MARNHRTGDVTVFHVLRLAANARGLRRSDSFYGRFTDKDGFFRALAPYKILLRRYKKIILVCRISVIEFFD